MWFLDMIMLVPVAGTAVEYPEAPTGEMRVAAGMPAWQDSIELQAGQHAKLRADDSYRENNRALGSQGLDTPAPPHWPGPGEREFAVLARVGNGPARALQPAGGPYAGELEVQGPGRLSFIINDGPGGHGDNGDRTDDGDWLVVKLFVEKVAIPPPAITETGAKKSAWKLPNWIFNTDRPEGHVTPAALLSGLILLTVAVIGAVATIYRSKNSNK
jgi:hypothetical protein